MGARSAFFQTVRILRRSTLTLFCAEHPCSEQPLRAWFAEVEKAAWTSTGQIRARYGTADFIPGDRVVFNFGGNNYRLIVAVKYSPLFLVYIRFSGTHAEYDQIDAKTL